ncbi:MAG TPA: hypothetical protein VKB93_20280, partial [Thermoanaerobaculia bacterium]|nr:hypothetical protein [Thermoanaerobaculia bacterium]
MHLNPAGRLLCVAAAVLLASSAWGQRTVRDDEHPYRGGAPVRSTTADTFERFSDARLKPPPIGRGFAAEASTVITPGDAAGAVGPVHLVSSTNASFIVYDRSGSRLLQLTQDQFWIGEEKEDDVFFDPRIAYDERAGRWVAIALHGSISSEEGGADAVMVAASATSDATGAWSRYRLSNRGLDFTRLALTRDTIMVCSRFGGGDDFLIFSIDKGALYASPRELPARRYFGAPADTVPVDARDESVEYVVSTTARSILLNRLDRLDQPWLEFATGETSVSTEGPPAPQAG